MDPLKALFQTYSGPFSPHRQSIRNFAPKARVWLERGSYVVKTAETRAELEEVLRLRYEIFHRELLNRKIPVGIDIDRFDRVADHLIIRHKNSSRIVGAYRLISSRHSNDFYSQTEFQLQPFLRLPGIKLELSRACIHKDYRTGQVMHLLWRGVASYLQETNSDYLFGMASVWTMEIGEVHRISELLARSGHVSRELNIRPTPEYVLPGFIRREWTLGDEIDPESQRDAAQVLPPLFYSYLKMGAKVSAEPALDRDFRCVDFFTVLKVANLAKIYERRYSKNQ